MCFLSLPAPAQRQLSLHVLPAPYSSLTFIATAGQLKCTPIYIVIKFMSHVLDRALDVPEAVSNYVACYRSSVPSLEVPLLAIVMHCNSQTRTVQLQ